MGDLRIAGSAIRIVTLILVLALTPFVEAQPVGPSWIHLNPANPPPNGNNGGGAYGAAYDVATNTMIVYGGQTGSSVFLLSKSNGLGGTPAWSQYSAISGPVLNTPSAVYDPGTNQMILFGGVPVGPACNGAVNDTWSLSYANGTGGIPTWSMLSPAGPLPGGRHFHTAVYNRNSNRMIVFGGTQDCQAPTNDVWVLQNANGTGGTRTWVQLTPSNATLAGRYAHTAVYDATSNRMIVFGGQSGPGYLNDVWVLSNADGTGGTPNWTHLIPGGGPPSPKFGASAAYDQSSNRMIVFGGFNCPASGGPCITSNEVWVLSNANGLGGTAAWMQLSLAGTLPPARYVASSIYDPASNRMTIFGGGTGTSGLNDTWVLTNANGIADATAPVISPIVSGTLGNNGWYRSNVAVTWSVTDPESSITSTSGCGSVTVSTDTPGTTLTCTATSSGGTTSQSVVVKRDATAPSLTVSVPAASSFYGLNQPANASYSCSDPTSGVAAGSPSSTDTSGAGAVGVPSGSALPTGAVGAHSFVATCYDTAGNQSVRTIAYLVDATPPTISHGVTGTLGNSGWYRGNVTVTWSVTDSESPLVSTSGCGSVTISTDTAGLTLTCTATSGGGTSSQSVTIKRDATPPTTAVSAPAAAANYILNQPVNAGYSCSDATSGVVTGSPTSTDTSGAGTVGIPNGSPLPTNVLGAHTFVETCTDVAGNQSTRTVAYSVKYGFAGLFSPYAPPPKTFKAASTVPLKWQYTDYFGNVVNSAAASPSVTYSLGACSESPVDPVAEDAGSSGYQYFSDTNTWQFNWQTKGLGTGCYYIQIITGLSAQTNGPFPIQLK